MVGEDTVIGRLINELLTEKNPNPIKMPKPKKKNLLRPVRGISASIPTLQYCMLWSVSCVSTSLSTSLLRSLENKCFGSRFSNSLRVAFSSVHFTLLKYPMTLFSTRLPSLAISTDFRSVLVKPRSSNSAASRYFRTSTSLINVGCLLSFK